MISPSCSCSSHLYCLLNLFAKMGCFPIQQGRRRSKHKFANSAKSSSFSHTSFKILREFKLGSLSFRLNSNSTTNTNVKGQSTHYLGAQQGPSGPCTRARAALHNASSKLVRRHSRALIELGPSSSFSKVQEHCTHRREGVSSHGSIISFSAPIPSSAAVEDEEGSFNAHLFPLPLPPAATSAVSTSEDTSSQFVSSTGSASSSSSSSSVPFSACGVSNFSQNFKSYNNPLGSNSTTSESTSTELKNPPYECASAQPLPLPPAPDTGASLREFSYDELAGACLNFAPEFFIRDGGAGPVFRATVRHTTDAESAIDIAITRLSRGHTHSYKKWRAEVGSLARLSHPNICKVLGFSREDPSSSSDKVAGVQRERLLVYEHMSNGSLQSLLYCRKGTAPLDWATRIKIALGAAQGLAFLHERLPRQIIYKSFRTLNIQVDLNFNAKLSDYGFARSSKELPSSSPAHSLAPDDPYAAPETVSCNEVSAKSNVWSFGIMLLELLTGRQNMDDFFVPEERNLLKWCRPYLLDPKRLYLVMDPELKGRYSTRKAKMVADLALQCLMEDPLERPSMRDVSTSLSSHILMSNGADLNVNRPFAINRSHSNAYRYTVKPRYSKSYNLASVLASPGRSFTSNSHTHDLYYSPSHNSRTKFRGFLSGEISREASRSMAGCRGDHPFLSRSGFLSGEIEVHGGKPRRSSSKGDYHTPK